jgi:hypothetical protein
MRAIPEVESKIESGELSMSTASQVHRFLRQEKKAGNPVDEVETLKIIEACEGHSKRDIEKKLFSFSSAEAIAAIESTKIVSDALLCKTKKSKGLIQKSTFPGKLDTSSTSETEKQESIAPHENKLTSRFIPISIKRHLSSRSGNQCEFVNTENNTRCTSKHQLEFDHYPTPFSLGGKSEANNLRHLCFQHNQKHAMESGLHFG